MARVAAVVGPPLQKTTYSPAMRPTIFTASVMRNRRSQYAICRNAKPNTTHDQYTHTYVPPGGKHAATTTVYADADERHHYREGR
jgi:hypothetical protein